MLITKVFSSTHKPKKEERERVLEFLFKHLGEYGDPIPDIDKSIGYALEEYKSFGGFILVSYNDNAEITGAVIVNKTGMKGYIPDNILVYIATHEDYRGQGIGKKLMLETIRLADGDIALHAEPHNPAVFLYEKVGFKTKYKEMRYIKNN